MTGEIDTEALAALAYRIREDQGTPEKVRQYQALIGVLAVELRGPDPIPADRRKRMEDQAAFHDFCARSFTKAGRAFKEHTQIAEDIRALLGPPE